MKNKGLCLTLPVVSWMVLMMPELVADEPGLVVFKSKDLTVYTELGNFPLTVS